MKQWIEAAKRGDQNACAELVRHFERMAYTVAYARLNDPFLTEDAVQEAFAEAFAHLASLREAEAFPGWFKTIVARQCARQLRRKKHPELPMDKVVGASSAKDNVEAIVETREWQARLQHSVSGLPENQRLAVQLFYLQGYSIKEISSCLGVPVSALKKRLFEARKKLKSALVVSDFVSVFNDLYQGGERMLHIVNGDHVGEKLKQGSIQGEVLVWREIYSIGPVFANMDGVKELRVRAQFLEQALGIPAADYMATCEAQRRALERFDAYDEIVLWFEHDLFDQTMLCYLLHWFASRAESRTKLHLLCIGDYPGIDLFHGLGQLSTEQLMGLSGTWRQIGAQELRLGSALWTAYASSEVERHTEMLEMDTSALPFAHDAFALHLARFPSPLNGLGIVEQTVAELVEQGVVTPLGLFREVRDRLYLLGMGDWEFWHHLRRMATGPAPLLAFHGSRAFDRSGPPSQADLEGCVVALTDTGRRIAAGERDWVKENGWAASYGGLLLQGDIRWRWDREARRLVDAATNE